MYLTREHVEVIKLLSKGGLGEEEAVSSGHAGMGRAAIGRRIMELHIQGLVRRSGGSAYLTDAGKVLAEAVKDVETQLLPDPWIDSRVMWLLRYAAETGYVPPYWESYLLERMLWGRESGLTNLGRAVHEAYRLARPLIYLTPEISVFLMSLPSGPAPYDELVKVRDAGGFGDSVVRALEATRLLEITPPGEGGAIYALTRRGRRVKAALRRIPVYDSVILIDDRVLNLLRKGSLSPEELTELTIMHLAGKGGVSEFGKEMEEAAGTGEESLIPPIGFSRDEMLALKAVKEGPNKAPPGEPAPTEEHVAKALSELGGPVDSLGALLKSLEAKGLIKRVEIKNKDTYALTEHGEWVLSKIGAEGWLPSDAVKAATYAFAGRAPKPEWVHLAREHGVVVNDVTSRGEALVNLSARLVRRPILTKYIAAVLAKTPSKGAARDAIVRDVQGWLGFGREDILRAITEAESMYYVHVYPNDYVVLTEAGALMKGVVTGGNTDEFLKHEISITPLHYHVLRTFDENIDAIKKIWQEVQKAARFGEEVALIYNKIKKYTSVTLGEVEKALTQLRGYDLIGRYTITGAGKALLAAGEALLKTSKHGLIR